MRSLLQEQPRLLLRQSLQEQRAERDVGGAIPSVSLLLGSHEWEMTMGADFQS
ncbi:hypothetical protein KSC_073070 [Ktedonobacter sp. SOSP1-52]|nr:hypothetical protein KSC_073070 [Ktedonobacter sp. SOSP1-52]